MRLGLGSWAYAWSIGVREQPQPPCPMTALDLLRSAAQLGVKVVQIADNLDLEVLSETELELVRNTARELGIVLELGTTGVRPERLCRYLDLARFFGAGLVRSLMADINSRRGLADAERWLRQAMPIYESANVELALENYEQYSSRDLGGLVRKVDSPMLGVCLDTANSLGAGETLDVVVRELAPYVSSLHFKDFEITRTESRLGYEITGRPAGEGRTPIEWLLGELKAAGSDPNIILELWTPYAGSIEATMAREREWVQRSVEFLRRYAC